MKIPSGKLAGSGHDQVIELLERRRQSGASTRADGRKIGLIVEGGGMRGVLSAGSLFALDLLGYRSCFDVIFAVSAGSVNAAYFLSGQGKTGISIYFDDISSKRFINPARFWKIADIDYVYDHLVATTKPLDDLAIRDAAQEFYVTATDVLTGRNTLLDAKGPEETVARFLKASSALPVLYNRSVLIADRRYMDGGVTGGLPIDWALSKGCTDLLVLLSRPCSYVSKPPGVFERGLFRLMVGLRYPSMYRAFLETFPVRDRNRRLAVGVEHVSGVNVATICPDDEATGVDRTTIERTKLVNGAYKCAQKVFTLLNGDQVVLEDAFRPFRQNPS